MITEMESEICQKTLADLFEKYSGEPYLIQRLNEYITVQLPNMLETCKTSYIQRQQRVEELAGKQDFFTQNFLKHTKYYYSSSTEKFFVYDEINYRMISEDDILHHVLTELSKIREIAPWKQKTKVSIMKQIKQQNMLRTIPNSETIQTVLSFVSIFFKKKSEAKYFLTVLGDSIMKKNNDLVHIVSPNAKTVLRELNNIAQINLGASILHTIKYKYHEHDYAKCRIVSMNDSCKKEALWEKDIKEYGLNILCVCAHYSNRYENSDKYLENHCNDLKIQNSVFYLRATTPYGLVQKFATDYITRIQNVSITWKDIQYLWKHFLTQAELPAVLWTQTLKGFIRDMFADTYNEETDTFHGLMSVYLPDIEGFLKFWGEYVHIGDDEYEIDELISLYKIAYPSGKPIDETQVIELLTHYFPGLDNDGEKTVFKISCELWNKQLDVQLAIEGMREMVPNEVAVSPKSQITTRPPVSFYELYEMYCRQKTGIKVSKNYFEKWIYENLSSYIIDEKFISSEWFTMNKKHLSLTDYLNSNHQDEEAPEF